MLRRLLPLVLLCFATQASHAADLSEAVARLAPASHWIDHADKELLPWWRHPAAVGEPVGRFPTFRCRDGSAYLPAEPCDSLLDAPGWIKAELGRDYVRMQARQVFAYAMGFHLTGDRQLLAWAQAGADDIRQRALDPSTGSPATYYQNGKPLPQVGERTAQDVAYAGIALASVYYITRDAAVLSDLDRLHKHLMSYWDEQRGELRWTMRGPEREKRELVAQLDPLNAYMVLTTPLLSGERRQRWQNDMRRLAKAIRTQYCPGSTARCFGTLHGSDHRAAGARHNDFGHSGKAFWMLGLVGRQLNDEALSDWADRNGERLLRDAYIAETGSWASRWRDQGIEAGKSWWIYAELDQLAATLALRDASYAQYLSRTWSFWSKHFVDRRGHEVWGGVSASGFSDPKSLKQHHWKNGYHSLEHALISYLVSSALHGQPATLHYAGTIKRTEPLQPYFFHGRERSRDVRDGTLIVSFDLDRPALDGKPRFDLPMAETGLPLKGERVEITPAMLPSLLGVWEGEWALETGEAKGVFELDIRTLTENRIVGSTSAFDTPDGDKELDKPLDLSLRLEDGTLQVKRPDGAIVPYILSRDGDELYLQWKADFGFNVIFRVSPRPK